MEEEDLSSSPRWSNRAFSACVRASTGLGTMRKNVKIINRRREGLAILYLYLLLAESSS
ncbi:MAG: hypothetical protein Q8N87_02940 [bacterium]|nr:hypothetical protein [bacterium]